MGQSHVRRVSSSHLAVKTGTGSVVTVKLADNARISARSASNLAAIVPGVFLGTTATPDSDGTLSDNDIICVATVSFRRSPSFCIRLYGEVNLP